MFGSRGRQEREAAAAAASSAATAWRKETEEGVRLASGSRHQKPDHEFIHGWTQQRKGTQEYLDAQARDTAAKTKKRWW